MKKPLVLLVEDNPHIMDINTAALTMRGCRVLQAATVQACREQLRLHDVELIVLDILLPDGDGLTLCREIKENYDIPILFLSALGENEDIVQGLTAGGDDYLPKPYDLNVLVARVEARLRAGQRMRRCVRCGPLKLYLLSSKAYLGERDLMLTQKEFAVALYLARHRGQTVPADELYQEIWQQPMADNPQALRMTISRLKQKLGDDDAPVVITSYRGEGYCLESRLP